MLSGLASGIPVYVHKRKSSSHFCTGLYLQTAKQLAHGKAYGGRAAETAACAFFVLWRACSL